MTIAAAFRSVSVTCIVAGELPFYDGGADAQIFFQPILQLVRRQLHDVDVARNAAGPVYIIRRQRFIS